MKTTFSNMNTASLIAFVQQALAQNCMIAPQTIGNGNPATMIISTPRHCLTMTITPHRITGVFETNHKPSTTNRPWSADATTRTSTFETNPMTIRQALLPYAEDMAAPLGRIVENVSRDRFNNAISHIRLSRNATMEEGTLLDLISLPSRQSGLYRNRIQYTHPLSGSRLSIEAQTSISDDPIDQNTMTVGPYTFRWEGATYLGMTIADTENQIPVLDDSPLEHTSGPDDLAIILAVRVLHPRPDLWQVKQRSTTNA